MTRPEVVKVYNSSMGGVDLLDFLIIIIIRTFIRSKKWTSRMICHGIDLAVTNSWLEYRKEAEKLKTPKKDVLDLIHFRAYVGESFILTNSVPKPKRGRPSNEQVPEPSKKKKQPAARPLNETRYDGVGHFPVFVEQKHQVRCKMEGCTGKTYILCTKCKLNLCLNREKNCFLSFHQK